MERVETLLFALLRSVLLEENLRVETAIAAKEEAEELYDLASLHDLAHLVAYAFKVNAISFSEGMQEKFEKQQFLAVYRYEQFADSFLQISKALNAAEIPFLPLKGAVVRELYKEPWMRTACDIDVLVRPEDLEKAKNVLQHKLGYTVDESKGYHDISLHSPEGVHVELHFNLQENIEQVDAVLARAWQYAMPSHENEYAYRFSNEFLVFQITAHLAYHFVWGGCGIRPVLDLFLLLQKVAYDKDALNSLLEEAGLFTFFISISHLAKVWFAQENATELTKEMERYILSGGMYGSWENKAAMLYGEKGKFKYFISRLFVSNAELLEQYPSLQNKKFLTPLFHFKRWGRLILQGRKQGSFANAKKSKVISNEQLEAVSYLLKTLDLK